MVAYVTIGVIAIVSLLYGAIMLVKRRNKLLYMDGMVFVNPPKVSFAVEDEPPITFRTPQQCREWCGTQKGCKGWTVNKTTGRCDPKGNPDNAVLRAGNDYVSGYMDPPFFSTPKSYKNRT